MARCLIFVLLSALVIVGQSLSSPAGDINDGSSSDSFDTTAAKAGVQPDATAKMPIVVSKSMDADVGKKDAKPESTSVGEKSSAKPSERDAARTHLSNLGLLEILKNKLLPVQPFGYQQYVQQPAPIISTSSVHSVQPIAFPQTLFSHVQQPLFSHVQQPLITTGHISTPAVEHFASKPSYSISQQVIHKPLITEVQELVRKPVFAELQEVIHKPILTEVQQVIKRPVYTEHIIKHPSFNSLHQEVVEQPLHLQTQQYHLVTKPLSQIVQLPTQQLVQQPIVQQPIVQPVISSHVVSSPIATGQLSSGSLPYGFASPSPLSFPWGFTKPVSSGFSGSPFSGFVGSSGSPFGGFVGSSGSSPFGGFVGSSGSPFGGFFGSSVSSVSSPVISSAPAPVVASVQSPFISSLSSPVISSVSSSPVISSVSSSPVVSSVSSSPVVSEFAYPSYTFSSPLSSHYSPGELQFLTPTTCRSGSCGPRAADSSEMPMNFGGAEFTDNMQNGILYNSAAMPQANFVQANENLATPYYTQPQQQMYFQPMLPTTTGNSDKGGNDNTAATSMSTKSSSASAKSASSDSDDNNSYDKKYTVLSDLSDLNPNSQKQYPAMSLEQFFRFANEEMKRRNSALESENNKLENTLQKLRSNPDAMKAIEDIVDKALN